MSLHSTIAESYCGRLEGATQPVYAAMAERLKAPDCNSGLSREGIVGSNPARRTMDTALQLTALATTVAFMAAVVAILLP